jgi:hypothetical protein
MSLKSLQQFPFIRSQNPIDNIYMIYSNHTYNKPNLEEGFVDLLPSMPALFRKSEVIALLHLFEDNSVPSCAALQQNQQQCE